ncbi:MAG: type II toxin-antitoxin system VapC family toxin [Rhodopila sp.]
MTDFVLDNSVTMRWCFNSGSHAYADAVLRMLETAQGEAFVPILWRYEVSSVLTRAQKTGTLTAQRVMDFLELLVAGFFRRSDSAESRGNVGF